MSSRTMCKGQEAGNAPLTEYFHVAAEDVSGIFHSAILVVIALNISKNA